MKNLLNPGDHVVIGYDYFSDNVQLIVDRKEGEEVLVGSLPFSVFTATVEKMIEGVVAINYVKRSMQNN